jgi:glycosyltransferase involved in cell wall biosynthesis
MFKNDNINVLLISPDFFSGIGSMARHIANSVTDANYYFFGSADIRRHKSEFLKLATSVDIIHWLANLPRVTIPSDIDISKFQAPHVATIHHVDESLGNRGEKEEYAKILLASQCDAIQVVSAEWKDYLIPKTNTPVFLAHHAINPQKFIANRMIERPRTPFRIGAFGFAKEIRNRKRLDVLLDALCVLLKQNYQFELVVQGPFWNILEGSFLSKGIQIRNLGYLPTSLALKSYRYLDLYVCSSDIEGGPLPVLEALASGIPVVSTPVGVAIEALSMGGGILVKKGNPQDLALAIGRIIDNPSLYQRLSQEAVRVAESFAWEKIGKEYIAMYEAALRIRKPNCNHKMHPRYPELQRGLQLLRDIRRQRGFSQSPINYKQILMFILSQRIKMR